jgi:hypothetical protein
MARKRNESKPIATVIGPWLVGFAAFIAAVFAALVVVFGEAAARPIVAAGAALLSGFIALAWLLLHRLARPLDRLALDIGIMARENPGHGLGLGPSHWLRRLAKNTEALRARTPGWQSASSRPPHLPYITHPREVADSLFEIVA